MKLDRVVAFARPENVRSISVLQKLGFLPEGDCTDYAGTDCSFYFLPRERWRQRRIGFNLEVQPRGFTHLCCSALAGVIPVAAIRIDGGREGRPHGPFSDR
jgi:hypothetical protein